MIPEEPVAQAAAVYMRHEVKLSYRDVCKVFDGLFGMPFVPASAMAFSHRTAGTIAFSIRPLLVARSRRS